MNIKVLGGVLASLLVGAPFLLHYAAPEPAAPTIAATPRCCKICTKGCACGDSCIACEKTCRKPAGCACNAR